MYMAIDYLIIDKKVISNTYYGHGTDMDYFYPFKRHAKVTRMGILTSVSSHEEAIFRLNTTPMEYQCIHLDNQPIFSF